MGMAEHGSQEMGKTHPPAPDSVGGGCTDAWRAVFPAQEQCRQVGAPGWDGGVPESRDVNHAWGATGDGVKRELKHGIQNHPHLPWVQPKQAVRVMGDSRRGEAGMHWG